jgi:hypothetical protein
VAWKLNKTSFEGTFFTVHTPLKINKKFREKKMLRKIIIALLILILCLIIGCSTGLFTRMDSSAPSFGPILIGMTRAEAEMHLGDPIIITPTDEGHYKGLYEYEMDRSITDTIMTDLLDIVTLGMGDLIVSPVDRFKGCEHLIAIQYEMNDQYSRNDRVIKITDRVKIAEK